MQTGKGISCRRGATLVELIVALGIAALIVVVVVTTQHTLTRHASSQAEHLKTNDRVTGTTRELRDDLQNLFLPEGDAECAIKLKNDEDRLVTLSFCRWLRAAGNHPVYTNRLERVSYLIGERKGKPALLRSVKPVSGANAHNPAVTNWIEPGWPDIRVELHDGETWQSEWTTNDESPAAARIQFMAEAENNGPLTPVHETMIIIPLGMKVTSTVSRATNTER